MKKIYLTTLLLSSLSFGQNWKSVSEAEAYPSSKSEYKNKRNQKIFKLDRKTLDDILVNVSSYSKNKIGTIIKMPNDNGEIERFEIWESSNFSPKDQAKYSKIRSYTGKSLKDSSPVRFSTSPSGISSTIFRNDGISEFLETYSTDGRYYEVHKKSLENKFNCSTPELHAMKTETRTTDNQNIQGLKTYRLALSVTGEYSQNYGGTIENTLEAINNTMTRVNGILENQMAINLVLIDDVERLVYLDPETDPYSPYYIGLFTDVSNRTAHTWNIEVQQNLRDNVGEENYDLGHLLTVLEGDPSSRGNAGCIGCICETNFPFGKGSAYTASFDSITKGNHLDLSFAHEIGHQLGARHTFSHRVERNNPTQVEPGSGSTIMGYAGQTSYNIQGHFDDYFLHTTVKQIQDNLSTKSCGVIRQTLNTPPVITLEKTTYNIPISTAFKLDAKVSDNENDKIFVNWEQNDIVDIEEFTTIYANSRVRGNKVIGPNFSSFHPVEETYRYFPKFESILEGNLIRDVETEDEPLPSDEPSFITGESLTNVPRVYNFRVSARDNNTEASLTSYNDVVVNVLENTSAFKINTPNVDDKVSINRDHLIITWDVGNTNLSPIETTQVKVSISWDNGETFEELGIVDNDGYANFPMPENAQSTDNGYTMIEAVDNIFLAVKKFSTSSESLDTKEIDTNKSNIYPNPSNGNFTIEQKTSGNVTLEIVDLNGATVYKSTDLSTGHYKKQVKTKLANGVYFVKISSDEGQNISKIIIK